MKTDGYHLVPFYFDRLGGLNLRESRFDMDDNDASILTNFRYIRNSKGLTGRRGISIQSTNATFGSRLVKLIGQYVNPSTGVNHILAQCVVSGLATTFPLYYSTDGGVTWTVCRTAALASPNLDAFTSVQYNNVLYIFTKTGGVYSWAGADTLTALASTPNGYASAEVLDYLFTVDPATQAVRYSAAGTPTSWPAANSFQVGLGEGQNITALVSFKDRLVVFQDSSIFVLFLTGTPVNWQLKELSQTIGATGPYAVCVKDEWIYFIGRNGVYRTNLSTIELLSDKINDSTTFDGNRTSTTNLVWGMWDAIGYYKDDIICSINFGGVLTTSNRRRSMFVFNEEQKAWTRWIPNYASATGDNYIAPMNFLTVENARSSISDQSFPIGVYYGSSEFDGKTFCIKHDTTTQEGTDNNVAYTLQYQTKFFNFDEDISFKKVPIFNFVGNIPTGVSLLIEFLDAAGNVITSTTVAGTGANKNYKVRGPGFISVVCVRMTYSNGSNLTGTFSILRTGFIVRLPRPILTKAVT